MSDDLSRFLRSWEQPKARVRAGTQTISGDRLFITDPLDMAKSPLTTPTPDGTFDLFVYQREWMEHPNQPKERLNAFLAIAFSSNPTAHWEQVEAETAAVVYETDFSAEFGWMSILDSTARSKVTEASTAVENAFDDWLAKYVMGDPRSRFRDFAYVPFASGGGFVICSSGRGNGCYNAFLGRDSAGNPTELVVDFEVPPRPQSA